MSGMIRPWRFPLLGLLLALVACTPAKENPPTPRPATDTSWSISLKALQLPQASLSPGMGRNPAEAGDHLVLWTGPAGTKALGVALDSGKVAWRTKFQRFLCSSASEANDDGLIGVLLNNGSEVATCTHAALIDTDDGSVRWKVRIPRPGMISAPRLTIGDDAVVITGWGGMQILSLDDGSVIKQLGPKETGTLVPSAATDGNTVVLEANGQYRFFNANTGKQTRPPVRGPIARLGTLVSTSPLVVTALVMNRPDGRLFRGSLIDLSGKKPEVFGRSTDDPDGVPRIMTIEGTTAWLEYSTGAEPITPDGKDLIRKNQLTNPVGIDLTTHKEVGAIPGIPDTRLLGSHNGKIVLLTEGEIRLADPLNVDDYTVVDLPEGTPTSGIRLLNGYLYGYNETELAAARVPELAD